MGELLQPWHLLVLSLVFGFFFLIPACFYILTLQGALNKCAPTSRTLEPGMLWLCIVPLVNLVFQFFVVFEMAKSLRNEFNRRGIVIVDPTTGQYIGLAMCICACCSIVLGVLALSASMVLWIIYWIKIAEYSRILDAHPQIAAPMTTI